LFLLMEANTTFSASQNGKQDPQYGTEEAINNFVKNNIYF